MIQHKVTGIILAGGKSSRMGSEKGLVLFNKKPLIEYIIAAIAPFVSNIFIVAYNPLFKKYGHEVLEDIIKDCGPMGGIYTGLVNSNTNKNLVVSCDIPFITPEVLNAILSQMGDEDIIVPEHGNKLEPLCAVYSKNCVKQFEVLLKKKEWKIKNSFSFFNVKKIHFEESESINKCFLNINTPTELQQYTIK